MRISAAGAGSAATEAGRRYHRQARVVEFARNDDVIRSAVKGTATLPYRQTITLKERRGGTEIVSACTCPMALNCKHVAAALFHASTVASAAKAEAARNPETQLARLLGTARPPAASPRGATPAPADPDLSSGLLAWLDDLDQAAGSSGEDYPPDIAQRIAYLLVPIRDDPRIAQLGLQPVSARLRKDGTFAANGHPYTANAAAGSGPKYFRPSDGRIMRELSTLPLVYAISTYRLIGEAGADVLARVLETGRARLAHPPGTGAASRPAARRPCVLGRSRGGDAHPSVGDRRGRRGPGGDAARLRRPRGGPRRRGRDGPAGAGRGGRCSALRRSPRPPWQP